MDYQVKLMLDGFWNLYEEGESVYDVHDDHIPAGVSRDELEQWIIDLYECSLEED